MMKLRFFLKNNSSQLIVNVFVFFFLVIESSAAVIPTLESKSIVDSEEPPLRRIYSYDLQVDSQNNVHIIYSKPSSGNRSNVYYVSRVNGAWSEILVSPDAHSLNKSTYLLVGQGDTIHVCYTKYLGSSQPSYALVYRTISNGTPGAEKLIYNGQWWGKMQLGDNGYPIFIRSDINWQTDNSSKLVMHTTTDGETWDVADLNLPSDPSYTFLMADFVYSNGVYHITYGDSAHLKRVWKNKYMNEKEDHVFHNLHYATSTDGVNWTHSIVDNSQTLRNSEFWTSLVLDNGTPLVGMFKYAEYNNLFATGTSGQLSKWNGSAWQHTIMTNQIYADANEGMGVGIAVNGPGDYFGAWDSSPRYPQLLPPSPEGNTAMRRSGLNGKWENIAQLDSHSLEGSPKLRIKDGKLYYIGLGDYTDTWLYFREFSIATLSQILPLTDPPEGGGDSMSSVYKLLLMND